MAGPPRPVKLPDANPRGSRWLRGQCLLTWGRAVFEEKKVAVTLGHGVGGKTGGRDGGGEAGGLIVEEALDGAEVVADLGAAGAGAGVLEEAQAQLDQHVARRAAQEGPPHLRPLRGQPPEAVHMGMVWHRSPVAPALRGRMPDEAQEPDQGEEGLARHVARAEGAVEVEPREGLRRGRQAEVRLAPVGADPDEGVQEGEGAGHVPRRAERLDEADLGQRGVELGFADLPGDALGQPHQGTALPLLLPPTGRPVLGQAPPQIARLADVEQRALRAVEAIDAGLGRHAGQKVVAELPVEGPHEPIVPARAPISGRIWRGAPLRPSPCPIAAAIVTAAPRLRRYPFRAAAWGKIPCAIPSRPDLGRVAGSNPAPVTTESAPYRTTMAGITAKVLFGDALAARLGWSSFRQGPPGH